MATGKDTGPGRVTIHLGDIDEPFPGPFDHVLLHNFNFDGDELKPEHVDFLNRVFVPFLNVSGRRCRLEGHASKQGADAYNKQLSARRVTAVTKHLRQRGVSERQIGNVQAFGESRSVSELEDDEIDRAVQIHLVPTFRPRRRERPRTPDRVTVPKPTSPRPPPFVPPLIPPPIRDLEVEKPVQEIYMKIKWVEGGFGPTPGRIPQKNGGALFPSMLLTSRTTMGRAPSAARREFDIEHKFAICTFDFDSLENFTQQRLNVFVKIVDYRYSPPANRTGGPGFVIPRRAEDVLAIYAAGTPKEPPR